MIKDRFSGGLLMLLGFAIVGGAMGFYVPYQYEPLGPKAMPYLIGGLLILCGTSLLLAPRHEVKRMAQSLGASTGQRQLLLVLILLAYAFAYEPLGFILSSVVVCFGLAWLSGARFLRCCVVAISLALAGHLVLVQGLGLQLEPGLLRGWL